MYINRKNYESYFADYLDGSLSTAEVSELQVFLLLNDDLAELLEDIKSVRLYSPDIHYPHKAALRKEEQPEICRLQPDLSIRYPHKTRLYRRNRTLVFLWAAAAVVFLCLSAGYLLQQTTITHQPLPKTAPMVWLTPPSVEPMSEIIFASQAKLEKTTCPIQKPHNTEKKPVPQKKQLPLMKTFAVAPIGLPSPSIDYALSSGNSSGNYIVLPEILLTETAIEWKTSERAILSDNIFNSMIHAGKIIAELIKNKE